MMELPKNKFKERLQSSSNQFGLWCSLPGAYATEIVAGSGFDWLLIDTEHSPGDPLTVLAQLQAAAPYNTSVAVRPASNDPVLIKRLLDIGVQTLLIPYVQTPDEAASAVAATRYPPNGIRGVSALTRATRFGRVKDYGSLASREICVIVQVETVEALQRLDDIAAVDGVDGVFIGPADLAASMGYIGQLDHPEVVTAIETAISRLCAIRKPSGILTADVKFAKSCIERGSKFVAVGVDAGILARSTEALARAFTA